MKIKNLYRLACWSLVLFMLFDVFGLDCWSFIWFSEYLHMLLWCNYFLVPVAWCIFLLQGMMACHAFVSGPTIRLKNQVPLQTKMLIVISSHSLLSFLCWICCSGPSVILKTYDFYWNETSDFFFTMKPMYMQI